MSSIGARSSIKRRLKLPISTLRGQYVDNREWLADPSKPAIIVGTVDMIGSCLLFSGYGVSTKMRPYHAGMLGTDTLIVLDEAHLVPPFEALLRTIADDPRKELKPCAGEHSRLLPPLGLLSLSATGRETAAGTGEIFRLSKEDYQHCVVAQRLSAPKQLTVGNEIDGDKQLAEKLAMRAWELGTNPKPARVLVYCDRRTEALEVKKQIDERLQKNGKGEGQNSELLVGERRVRERQELFWWLQEHQFVGDLKEETQAPAFLGGAHATI